MIRGLVIGKFMPVHNGHIALINFAASQCDELIVSMSFTDRDPIPHNLRYNWLNEIFSDQKNIQCHLIKDDFDNEMLPLPQRTKLWARKMKEYYPIVHTLFSSEKYGEPFAENINAKHIAFDHERRNVPVSATLIRTQPFKYWDYIPTIVRPYFVKKICFYGPESTGKTFMAKRMAEHFQTDWVPEAARSILASNEFSEKEIIKIAVTHDQHIHDKMQTANKLLFCDTDVITTKIYSRLYLNSIPDVLSDIENRTAYDLYFLMDVDVPWIEDPLRDLGNRREEMMRTFKSELELRKIPYILIQGNYQQREEKVITEINKLLQKFL